MFNSFLACLAETVYHSFFLTSCLTSIFQDLSLLALVKKEHLSEVTHLLYFFISLVLISLVNHNQQISISI